MGFFKDFKDDFSQALNELMPGEDITENEELENDDIEESLMINTIDEALDVEAELNKLDGLLIKVEEKVSTLESESFNKIESPARVEEISLPELKPAVLNTIDEAEVLDNVAEDTKEQNQIEESSIQEEETVMVDTINDLIIEPEPVKEEIIIEKNIEIEKETLVKPDVVEELKMDTFETKIEEPVVTNTAFAEETAAIAEDVKTDEVTIITEGTSLTGNISTCGSIEVKGKISGDIKCAGKLTVTGYINGNSSSEEFFADSAFVEGEVVSTGTVKVGLGSRIIGNISSTSAVIAGAVKGDIDVHGPVVVDSSAVILGNIKSKSVQINNGAVIEGFCSQCYSDVNVEDLFSNN